MPTPARSAPSRSRAPAPCAPCAGSATWGPRILVTGATGGVGRYAVQLARLGGAHVIASTGDPDAHGDGLRTLGAHQVVKDPAEIDEPVHGVVDVGGPQLVAAYDKLAAHGTLVSVGHVTGQPETFPFGALYGNEGRHNRSIVTFYLLDRPDIGADLGWLAERVATGDLDPQITWRGRLGPRRGGRHRPTGPPPPRQGGPGHRLTNWPPTSPHHDRQDRRLRRRLGGAHLPVAP
ncbi:hypothetical protein SANTM175S_00794 [Streptomyces antimycoticus]